MKKIILALCVTLLLCSCTKEVANNNTDVSPSPEPTVVVTPEPTPVVTSTPESTAKVVSKPASKPAPKSTPKPATTYTGSDPLGALDNTGSGWGFVKVKGSKPNISQKIQDLFAKYDAYCMDNSGNKVLYLTFDEGYENGYTGKILDTLKKCDVPAAFFITGSYFDRETALVDRMINEGHIVGNHTENHKNLHKLVDPDKMRYEFSALDDKFYQRYGQHMRYMRPPEGEFSERVLAVAQDAGYRTTLWSFAYKDWEQNNIRGAQYAFDSITPYLHSGCIILLHAVSSDNANALENVINYAKEHGYVFKSLDALP